MKNKFIIITGATSGIGKVAAIELAKVGAIIVFTSRDETKGEKVKEEIIAQSNNQDVEMMVCDLASFASIRSFCDAFKKKHDHLHVLINNAGIWELKRNLSQDGIELTLAVNHLAPFLMTNLLLDTIKANAPARVINVSSGLHFYGNVKFDDLEGEKSFNGSRAYCHSKLMNVLFTKELARKLQGSGVTVNSMHPGVVATSLSRNFHPVWRGMTKLFFISPQKGAETLIYLATSPEVEGLTGKYFYKKRAAKYSKKADDDAVASRLWQVSEDYVRDYLK